jgi:hypothetical protein
MTISRPLFKVFSSNIQPVHVESKEIVEGLEGVEVV